VLQRRAHRYRTLSILSSLLYLLLFPFSVHLIAGGEFFGAFLVVPLSLIALGWGQRAGIAAAAT